MEISTTRDFIIDKNTITNPTAKFALDNINGVDVVRITSYFDWYTSID